MILRGFDIGKFIATWWGVSLQNCSSFQGYLLDWLNDYVFCFLVLIITFVGGLLIGSRTESSLYTNMYELTSLEFV